MMKKYDLKGIERRLSTYVFLMCDVGGYLEEVKFSKAEIAALDKILSKTSQFNKNPELFANELKVLDINLENYIF